MTALKQWYLIENDKDYQAALARFDTIKKSTKGSPLHKEKLLLAFLIAQYEEKQWQYPDLDPIELIKIRMEDFGYKSSDLAIEYGDKGTISKVLNYKQPLSLTMIRKFAALLRIPPSALTKEYSLV
jgi:HTH-type transcriptional regulator / antitoxin HigA